MIEMEKEEFKKEFVAIWNENDYVTVCGRDFEIRADMYDIPEDPEETQRITVTLWMKRKPIGGAFLESITKLR